MSNISQYADIFKNARHIHFVGIGGVSMSALAMIAKSQGKKVTGSDISESEAVLFLQSNGIQVFIGHQADNALGCDLLVYTAAIKDNNPELVFAKSNRIPHCERAVLLGLLMQQYPHSISVSGTHGKTTTTSMLASVFMTAGKDPTVLVGAKLSLINGNYRIGQSEYSIYEACEYCNSFWNFYPQAAIILNIDKDHLDFFKDLNDIQNSFAHFTHNIEKNGVLFINGDDENCSVVIEQSPVPVITFGTASRCDFTAQNIRFDHANAIFTVCQHAKILGEIRLNVNGRHNILNALSVIAVATYYGIPFTDIQSGITAFCGADRRFQLIRKLNGADIIDDYAHHPTEIAATICAAKDAGYRSVTVIFQSHTFTRTALLMDEFGEALRQADHVIITDIYAAREINQIGVSVTHLIDKIPGSEYIGDFSNIAKYIQDSAVAGECYILMGAGDINQVAKLLPSEK